MFCKWGRALVANWSDCRLPELYNHTADNDLYDVEGNGEYDNLASQPSTAGVQASLRAMLEDIFDV